MALVAILCAQPTITPVFHLWLGVQMTQGKAGHPREVLPGLFLTVIFIVIKNNND